MDRYYRFTPVGGESNAVLLSLGDVSNPVVVEDSAVHRLHVLLQIGQIKEGCEFAPNFKADLPCPPNLIDMVAIKLFPKALKLWKGEPEETEPGSNNGGGGGAEGETERGPDDGGGADDGPVPVYAPAK